MKERHAPGFGAGREFEGTTLEESRRKKKAMIWMAAGYAAMVLGAIGAFLLIRAHGETLRALPPSHGEALVEGGSARSNVLLRVLVAMAAVIAAGQVLAKVFARLGQPPVIGEVVGGILLGPSLLGPERSGLILPPSVAPYLGVVAQLGVILYMFVVGLELNAGALRRWAHATVATSHASILLPFVLGALLALGLYPRLSSNDIPFTSFALFMGVAMSITAFPVLARILTDRGMTQTELGTVALSCAAADDVTAWCLLAFVVGVAKAQVGEGFLVAGGALLYIALMFLAVRPVLHRCTRRWQIDRLPSYAVTAVFCGLLLSTITTEVIGIHAIFGRGSTPGAPPLIRQRR